MNNKNYPLAPSRLASQGLKFLSIGVVTLASLGCNAGLEIRPKRPTFAAQAEFGGVATAQAVAAPTTAPAYQAAPAPEGGPTANNYVQSGGGAVETAELTTAGATITGRVAKGAPRFYAIDLAVGDSLSFKIYMRQLEKGYSSFYATLLEPDMVKLAGDYDHLDEGPDSLERKTFTATASQAGRHYLKVAGNDPIEYRIEITGVNQAAR